MKYMAYSLARLLLLVITPNNGLAVVALQGGEDQQRQNVKLCDNNVKNIQYLYEKNNYYCSK